MTASDDARGTSRRGTERPGTATAGNPGVVIGTQEIGGQPYARYRATGGTWVSASLREQGYPSGAGRDSAYGAYAGLVRASDGAVLANPDRIRPGQEYLVPVRRSAQAAPPSPPAAQSVPAQPVLGPRTFELFADRDTSRGTGNRYRVEQPASAPPVLEAKGPLLLTPLLVRPAASGLSGLLARLLGPGGLPTRTPTILAGVAAAAAVGWSASKWQEVYAAWQSSERARIDAQALAQQSRQGVHTLWQNGIITDDEYFLYLSTGTLVVQPQDGPGAMSGISGGSASTAERERAADENWWRILQLGNAYNRARLFDFPFNEVIVEGSNGERFRVDAFAPFLEIVSRKFTQFARISIETGIRYVRELVEKYHPGTRIADVPSSEGVLKITSTLSGKMILSVPVQRHPIPRAVLEEAGRLNVTIRDDFGNEFILDKPQPAYQPPPLQLESIPPETNPAVPPPSAPDDAPTYIDLTE